MFILATFWHFLVTSIWFLLLGYGAANTGTVSGSKRPTLPTYLTAGLAAQTIIIYLFIYFGVRFSHAWKYSAVALITLSASQIWRDRSDFSLNRAKQTLLNINTLLALLAVAGIGILFQRMRGFGIAGILIDTLRNYWLVIDVQAHGLPVNYPLARERAGASILVAVIKTINRMDISEALVLTHFFTAWLTQWILADVARSFFKKLPHISKWLIAGVSCAVFFSQMSWYPAFHGFLNQTLFTLTYATALAILIARQSAPNLLFLLLINCLAFMSYSLSMSVPLIISEVGILIFYRRSELLSAIRSYRWVSWAFVVLYLVYLSILVIPSYEFISIYKNSSPEMATNEGRMNAGDIRFFTELTDVAGLTYHENDTENSARKEIRSCSLGGVYLTVLDGIALFIVLLSMAAFFFIEKRLMSVPLIWLAFMAQFRLIVPYPYAYFKYTSLFSIAMILGSAMTVAWLSTKRKQILAFCVMIPLMIGGALQFVRSVDHFSVHGSYLAPAIPRLSKVYKDLHPICEVNVADSYAPVYWNYWMQEFFPPFSTSATRSKDHCILMTSDRFILTIQQNGPSGVLTTDDDWGLFIPRDAIHAH